MRIRHLGLLLLLTLLVSAPSADAACREGAKASWSDRRKASVRSTVVVCAGGRERTVRRGTISTRERGSGTFFGAVSMRGGRVAISSIVRGRGRTSDVIELLSARTGKSLFRRAQKLYEDPEYDPMLFTEQVEVTEGGALAWTFGEELYLRRPTGTVERLKIDTGGPDVIAVEDGNTLRYGNSYHLQYLDLARPPGRPCPKRAAFRPTSTLGGIQISTAQHRVADGRTTVTRACDPATGRDAVLGLAWSEARDDYSRLAVIAAAAPHVLVTRLRSSTGGSCWPLELTVVDVRTGRPARAAKTRGTGAGGCGLPASAPVAGVPAVITASGAPAWVARGALHTIAAGGKVATLDAGPVTDLTADGTTVRWRRAGVDRSATL